MITLFRHCCNRLCARLWQFWALIQRSRAKTIDKNALAKSACNLERIAFTNAHEGARNLAAALRHLIVSDDEEFVRTSEVEALIASAPADLIPHIQDLICGSDRN